MSVNAVSLIASIAGLPAQTQGARILVETLLGDKLKVEQFPVLLREIKSNLNSIDRKLRRWQDEWDVQDGLHETLLEAYWGGEGCAEIDDMLDTIQKWVEVLQRDLTRHSPNSSTTMKKLKTPSLLEVRDSAMGAIRAVKTLEDEAWELLENHTNHTPPFEKDGAGKRRKRRCIKHKTYLLALGRYGLEQSATLKSLHEEYLKPDVANLLGYHAQDIALDLMPGVKKSERLCCLAKLARTKRIIQYSQLRHLSIQGPALEHAPAQLVASPIGPPASYRSSFLEVQFIPAPDHNLVPYELKDVISRCLESPPPDPMHFQTSVLLETHKSFSLRVTKTTAETSMYASPANLNMATFHKIDLAFKTVESMFVLQQFGWMKNLCSCALRMIHLVDSTNLFGVDVSSTPAPACCKLWHQALEPLHVGQVGLLLAELALGSNQDSLERIAQIPVTNQNRQNAEIEACIREIGADLNKVDRDVLSPSFINAVEVCMRPGVSGLEMEEYYKQVIKPLYLLFDEMVPS